MSNEKENKEETVSKWQKKNQLGEGLLEKLNPLIHSFLQILETEKKLTEEKLEKAKALLEKLKQND